MHVLQITPQLPWPPDNGGRMALYQLVRQIGRHHQLTLLSFCQEDPRDGIPELAPFCDNIVTVEDHTGSVFSLLDSISSERPLAMSRFHSRAVAKRAADLCEQREIDLVHFDHLHTAAYVRALPPQIPTILRQHNVESRILSRYAETAAHRLLRPLIRSQARAVARYEATSCARFDRCLAVTPVDAAQLRELSPSANIDVLPDGVDTDYFQPDPRYAPEDQRVVTTGDYSWGPTRDGLLFLCREVWPEVRQRRPEARLTIVGRNIPEEVIRGADQKGLDIAGYVEDVRPEILRGTLFIAPTRVGSGIRIKILEAMALGRPVVATTIGAEGIAAADGHDLRIADSHMELAGAIEELLDDRDVREKMAAAALELVRSRYAWDALGDQLANLYAEVREEKRANG